jgi:hypothetical protein
MMKSLVSIAMVCTPAVWFFDSKGFTKRRRLVSIVVEENEAFFIGALVEGVRTISPTVCTAANSQKPALGPTHPFESYHTSRLAGDEAGTAVSHHEEQLISKCLPHAGGRSA